ncbi:hypothetical protein ACM66B_004507 [Microbotryomycetes sp. NB124-2]
MAESSATSAAYDFSLLKLVNEARATYGLRHQDYARYHAHCTAKVHHLRKSTKLVQTTSNKNKKFSRKDVTAQGVSSAKHLQILLFESERAWAHAQEVKSSVANAQSTTGSRKHFIKRLARAVSRAEHLYKVVTSLSTKVLTAQRGQTTAYFLSMKGSLEFEKGRHEAGLKSLSVAHELLVKLADTASSAHEQALANELIDEVEPMLRFCAYKSGLDTSAGVAGVAREATAKDAESVLPGYSTLVDQLDKEGQQGSREAVELSWRGRDVPVRSAELVDVVIKVKQTIVNLEADRRAEGVSDKDKGGKRKRRSALGSRRMATFDKALLVLSDAEAFASQLVDDNKVALSKSTSARHEAASAPLQLARAFIAYQLLAVRIKRDLLLVQDTAAKLDARELKIRETDREYVAKTGRRDEDKADRKIRKQRARMYPSIVKLYDSVIQSLEQMRDLEAVEQDGELATKVEARIASARASRCMYLARSYALVEQHASALSLNSRGKIYSRQARHNATSVDDAEDFDRTDFADDLLPLSDASFDKLDEQLESDNVSLSRGWFSATGGRVGNNLEPEDLAVDELEIAPGPSTKPKTKKKPAFYDVAFNYVAAFDMEAIARRAGLKAGAVADEDEDEFHEAAEDDEQAMDAEEEEYHSQEEEEEEQQQEQQPAKRGWGFGLFGRR